jgi:hypothetical protein
MRRVLAGLAALALTACINDSVGIAGGRSSGTGTAGSGSGGPSTSVSGIYTLRTAAGQPLPYTFFVSGTDKTEILDDAFTLTDSTWVENGHVRRTAGGSAVVLDLSGAGKFTKAPNGDMSFVASDNSSVYTGKLSGSTLTMDGNSPSGAIVPYVFTK